MGRKDRMRFRRLGVPSHASAAVPVPPPFRAEHRSRSAAVPVPRRSSLGRFPPFRFLCRSVFRSRSRSRFCRRSRSAAVPVPRRSRSPPFPFRSVFLPFRREHRSRSRRSAVPAPFPVPVPVPVPVPRRSRSAPLPFREQQPCSRSALFRLRVVPVPSVFRQARPDDR